MRLIILALNSDSLLVANPPHSGAKRARAEADGATEHNYGTSGTFGSENTAASTPLDRSDFTWLEIESKDCVDDE